MNRLLYVAVLMACVYAGGALDAVRAVEGPFQASHYADPAMEGTRPLRSTSDAAPGSPPSPGDEVPRVHALFDFSIPETGPFPSDYFTVADEGNNTGRRVSLPYPDCGVHASDCEDLDVINTFDGFGLQTRISIPFDGHIDPATVSSQTVFLISLPSRLPGGDGGGTVTGINQVVWDPTTLTLHVETNDLLDQHRRYAVIVTSGVLDTTGTPVKATKAFRHLRTELPAWYRESLLEAIGAAAQIGVKEQDIVVASVYSTQSITSVMERIRDQIKAEAPAPATFALGPTGQRAVFDAAAVSRISWRQQTRVNPAAFTTVNLDISGLQVVPGAVGRIAYGTYASPDYQVHPGEYIPQVATRTGVPVVQGQNTIYFSLFLPSAERPAAGWPVVIFGSAVNQHYSANFASILASKGIATISINTPGAGFGPESSMVIQLADGTSVAIPDGGRGIDQDGNGLIGATEGATAARPRAWTIGERDGYRQNVVDLMQLVRVIEIGVDGDGDGSSDLDPGRIFFWGASAGAMYGTMFVALDPSVSAAVLSVPGGSTPEHARWSPVRRPGLGASLWIRTPSLINSPGITGIDGVVVNAPHYDENKPLRDLPSVTNTIAGAMEIQRAFEMQEWGSGQTPVAWARHVRQRPLDGVYPKSVIYQFAKGDQQANNPGMTALLRAGDLADSTLHYRHDLAFMEDSTLPKNPHLFVASPLHANALFRGISRGAQQQAATFFASGGTSVIHPEPVRFFEMPILGPLPETLNYVK